MVKTGKLKMAICTTAEKEMQKGREPSFFIACELHIHANVGRLCNSGSSLTKTAYRQRGQAIMCMCSTPRAKRRGERTRCLRREEDGVAAGREFLFLCYLPLKERSNGDRKRFSFMALFLAWEQPNNPRDWRGAVREERWDGETVCVSAEEM